MKKTLGIRAIMPVATLLVFSGCAKQAVTTADAPLGGHLPNAPQTQTAQTTPVPPLTTPAEKNPVRQESADASGNSSRGDSLKGGEGAASTLAGTPLQSALEKIYFDFDSSILSPAARQTLAENYRILQKNAAMKIRIEGNCDERGSDEYNLALGERRARAAARYLATLGIPEERISTMSLGEEKPAVPGHDETSWAKNRRDEFIIIGR